MIKLLPGLFAFFFLTTVIYAAATSIGFDKPEYLIPPGQNQQIYAQLRDSSGQVIKAEATTYVYIYPGSTTARVSSAISTPSFSATAKLTIAKGTTQRSFLYLDSNLGTSTLTATSSGLPNSSLKITIGFPPPPPPPVIVVPPPPPVVVEGAPPTVPAKVAPTPVISLLVVDPEIAPGAATEIPPVPSVTTSVTAPATQSQAPQVLAVQSVVKVDNSFSFLTELLSWFRRLLSDNIGL